MLHLHTNTVAYRVARIESITGLALGDPDDRLVAHVAVKIIESQGSATVDFSPATEPAKAGAATGLRRQAGWTDDGPR
jgi:hypothetical protein